MEYSSNCCLHYKTIKDDTNVVHIKSLSTWTSILHAARLRKYEHILLIAKDVGEGTFPAIQYHKSCKTRFTLKRDIDSLKEEQKHKEHENQEQLLQEQKQGQEGGSRDDMHTRSKLPTTSDGRREHGMLPAVCMFCQKTKRINDSRVPLTHCLEFRADKTVRKSAEIRKDARMLAITSDDLIAKEAVYHSSCYKNYTRICYQKDNNGKTTFQKITKDMILSLIEEHLILLRHKPDVVPFSYFCDRMTTSLNEMEDVDKKEVESARKNLRRNIEERYPTEFRFQTMSQRLFIFPDTLTLDLLIAKHIVLKVELEGCRSLTKQEKVTLDVAKCIRDEVSTLEDKMPWPPQPEHLTPEKFTITRTLSVFLTGLLHGRITGKESSRVSRLKMSFAQDLVYAVTRGSVKTPKSVLFASVIKTLTNSTELINLANKLGHGISYSTLTEMNTENAYMVWDNKGNGLLVPPGAREGTFTIYVADNIDRLEETLGGFNTTHNVNNLILQNGKFNHIDFENPPKSKRCRRSFNVEELDDELTYITGARIGPKNLVYKANKDSELLKAKQRRRYFGWVTLRKNNIERLIPSWTGFQITVSNNSLTLKTSVGYMQSIDSPATDMTTIFQVMCRALKIKDTLKLPEIVCVFDQAIFAKAAEIQWKQPDTFHDVVIMLGIFHLIMMYMGILSKRFKDAGLFDILVQSSVLAESSCESALSGKMYNRGVRAYKLMYEALMQELIEIIKSDQPDTNIPMFDEEDLQADSFEKFINTDTFVDFETNVTHLRDRFSDGTGDNVLRKFWLSYVEMVELLLNTLYATRTGDWDLYLECVRDIIPYTFAYDNYNYARYLTPMLGTMLGLEESHPFVYENCKQGFFTVQLTEGQQFSRVEPDKVIEMTLNKDSKSSGGTTGFSLNSGAVHRWELNATYRAALRRCLHEHTSYRQASSKHADLSPSRIKKDMKDVSSIIDLMNDTFLNPFSLSSDLVSISSGVTVPKEVIDEVLNAKQIGIELMESFTKDRLETGATIDLFESLPRRNLFTFSKLIKSTKIKVNGKEVILIADKNLFGKISIIMQKRQFDLASVFKYPLGLLPWSLSGSMGELKKTNKSSLLHKLEGPTVPVTNVEFRNACIIDGMAIVRQSKVSGLTFWEFAKQLLKTVVSIGKCSERIDVVFDRYDEHSIKNAERLRRSSKQLLFKTIVASNAIKQWNQFLSNGQNKEELIKFLAKQWTHEECMALIGDKDVYVTTGSKCIQLSLPISPEILELRCTQEEADTRLLLHAQHASDYFANIIIYTPDTDVFMIALAFKDSINSNLYIKTGVKKAKRLISLNLVADYVHRTICKVQCDPADFRDGLLGLHCFTGCDTVSAFSGKGKAKPLNIMGNSPEYIMLFKSLGQSWTISPDLVKGLEKFVCHLYGSKTCDVNALRYKMYCTRKAELSCELLPPCFSSLNEHILRANYQTKIWRSALISNSDIPSPEGHGWYFNENQELAIKWMECRPAPDEILELVTCDCKKKCEETSCVCIQLGFCCTDACTLTTCSNVTNEELEIHSNINSNDCSDDDDDDDDDDTDIDEVNEEDTLF